MYSRIVNKFFRCANCNNGAVACFHDQGNEATAVLDTFIPSTPPRATLPPDVPQDLISEFRESENVAGISAFRAATALLRSVLEKCLKKNGYEEVEFTDKSGNRRKSTSLLHRIEAAADDGVITQARKQRVHENIRVLGNDVLHDDWREVSEEEFTDSHRYAQRILEDLYDDRATVETVLIAKGRLAMQPPATPITP